MCLYCTFIVVFTGRSEVELKGAQVEQSEASSVSFSLDDDPEGLEDSTWSYDTNIKDLDDFVGQVTGPIQADKEIRSVIVCVPFGYHVIAVVINMH